MVSRSLSGLKLNLKLTATVLTTLDDLSSVTANQPVLTYAPSLANGIEQNQADRGWHSEDRALANGAQEILDLHRPYDIGVGVGKDATGQDLIFEEVVAIVVVNENAVGAAGLLEVFPSPSEGWAPIGSHTSATGGALAGQGMLTKVQLASGAFDVAEQKHRITFRAIGGAVTYSVYVLGRHDDEESSSSGSSSLSSSSMSSSSRSSISTSSSSQSISESSQSTSSSSQSSSSQSSRSSISTSSSSQSPSESSSSLSSS